MRISTWHYLDANNDRGHMSKVDNKKIGDAAVSVVKDSFRKVECVVPFLETNDNGICTDGYLEVYSTGKEMSKRTLLGRIDVQVKGTTSKLSSPSAPSRKVDTNDLRRYLDVYSGVLYFVVYLDGALDVKGVYYKQYLPFDIKKSLERCKPEQKTLKERFARLPDDEGSLCILCREFVANKQKQASVASTGIKTLDEWSRDGIQFDKLELSKKCLTDSVSIDLSFFGASGVCVGGNRPEPPARPQKTPRTNEAAPRGAASASLAYDCDG